MPQESFNSPRCYVYIRFSTKEQNKGDSLRRQTDLAKSYAKEKGLTIDDSSILIDDGFSGFSGAHQKYGKLGDFLKLVQENTIPKGSILLIESFDRLTRETPLKALKLWESLLNKGLTIETIGATKASYSVEGLKKNPMNIFGFLVEAIRGYSESSHKSERLAESWKNKRTAARENKKPMTSRAPAWLKLNKKTMVYEKIKSRCEIVKQIFEMSADEIGIYSITRHLNENSIPIWQPTDKKDKRWRRSYINKILHNRAVIGEFQPHQLVERQIIDEKIQSMKKSIPIGEAIPDYFPQVISDNLFYKAQEKLKANKVMSGRTGKISNLFSHLAKCGYCGASMIHVNKGNSSNVNQYLVCDNGRMNTGCKYVSVPYSEFEEAFLQLTNELDVDSLIIDKDNHRKNEIKRLTDRRYSIDAQISEIKSKLDSLDTQADLTKSKENLARIVNRQEDAINEKNDLIKELQTINRTLKELEKQKETYDIHLQSIQKLFSELKTKTGEEIVLLRFELRKAIRTLVEKILVFPEGMKGTTMSFEDFRPEYLSIKSLYQNEIQSIEAFLPGEKRHPLISDEQIRLAKEKIKEYKNAIQLYTAQSTGRDKRVFHIFFNSGAWKEIQYDPILGYGITGELNDQKLRLGDDFQLFGDMIAQGKKNEGEVTKPAEAFGSDATKLGPGFAKDIVKQMLGGGGKKIIPKPKIEKFLYNPHPEKSRMIEVCQKIVELRDKGLKLTEIKNILERDNIKSFNGKSNWQLSTISRIYKRSKNLQ